MPRAPRPPRRPPSLRPPAPPRLGPLRLAPIRSQQSVDLDRATTPRSREPLPPFVRFDQFLADWEWNQGEHLTTIGPTGSGKTVLNRYLLRRRDFVVVLGIKKRDKELYTPFEADGYELVRTFDPEPPDGVERQRLLFVPRTDKHGAEGRAAKAKKFRQALNDIYDTGNWTVYADDIQYMADQLRLAPEFEELWMLGRSEGDTVVASSTEPVNIPVMAYGMAKHLFLFRNDDLYRARRMAELAGTNREIVQTTLLQLPEHEFLYIDKRNGRMLRSRVIRPAGA
jgi:hypothetical protein